MDLGDALRAGEKGVRKRAEASNSLRLGVSSVAGARQRGPAAMSGSGGGVGGGAGGSPNNTEWRFNQTLRNVQG